MNVLVLLSTYNGEKFLREQLDSILSQKDVNVFLMVRDDGSTDQTCELLKEYAGNYPNITWEASENIGFAGSFSRLLEMALASPLDVDYYAFVDQDDVWLPNKLKVACEELSQLDQRLPILFSSNSFYVDEHLNPMGLFHPIEPYRTKENVMLYPTEQGCSMVFNRKTIERYLEHPPVVTWHDRWLCLICNFFGEMRYCHTPLFYYRIHGHNALGKVNATLWQRLWGDIKLLVMPQVSKNLSMIKEFYDVWGASLDETTRGKIETYIHYPQSYRNKLKLIFCQEYQHSHSLLDRCRKAILVLSNKL